MTHRIAVSGLHFAPPVFVRSLRAAVRRALRAERLPYRCRVELRLADDVRLREVNIATRGVYKTTDVLSFPSINWASGEVPRPEPEDGKVFLGEILISVERAAKQAQRYGHSFERELCYLGVHGLLHLLGCDHETETDRADMRRREEAALRGLSLSR